MPSKQHLNRNSDLSIISSPAIKLWAIPFNVVKLLCSCTSGIKFHPELFLAVSVAQPTRMREDVPANPRNEARRVVCSIKDGPAAARIAKKGHPT